MSDFLMTIPERLHQTIHTFCTDMWDAYIGAATDFMAAYPNANAQIVIDRFHVAKNYRADFDALRKQELRRLRQELPKETYQEVAHGMHWVLRHNHANLDEVDKVRLRALFQRAPQLHQAYTLREELTAIFNQELDLAQGQHRLEKWAAKVERSPLNCFDSFLKTLSNRFTYIAAYFQRRANSGFVEGFNNKLKTLTRRSFGIKRVNTLFQRLWLDTNGYQHFLT